MRRKRPYKRFHTRMARIERKCDLILSELIILRQRWSQRPDIDSLIDRLHQDGKRMRALCERERDAFRERFSSGRHEDR